MPTNSTFRGGAIMDCCYNFITLTHFSTLLRHTLLVQSSSAQQSQQANETPTGRDHTPCRDDQGTAFWQRTRPKAEFRRDVFFMQASATFELLSRHQLREPKQALQQLRGEEGKVKSLGRIETLRRRWCPRGHAHFQRSPMTVYVSIGFALCQ